MTTDRRQALLAKISAELLILKADRVLKQCAAEGMSISTVHRVLHGGDHKISTLVDLADALECDVEITIHKRSA